MKAKLTTEEEKELATYREYCLERGRATDTIDVEKITRVMGIMYREINKSPPKIIICESPHQAQVVINKLNNKKPPQYHPTYFWGQQDYYWISFYRFAEKNLGVRYKKEDSEKLALWESLAESAHWIWCFEDTCVVSHKPMKLNVDIQGRLHNDHGAAIEYRDGYAQYYLHGVSVPKELAEIKKEEMDPVDLGKYKNAEVRMQFIKKIGVARLKERGVLIDKESKLDEPFLKMFFPWMKDKMVYMYELIDMHSLFENTQYAPYLFMVNPSTGETHAEGVHPDCHTVRQAINWRAGDINRAWEPLELT